MMKRARLLNWIATLKYYFFKYGIHGIIPMRIPMFLAHLHLLSKWIRINSKLSYTDFPSKTFVYKKREDLFSYVIQNEIASQEIDYFEFGVSTGNSFIWWVDKLKNPNARFYGFDTFTGLPEAWGPFEKNSMSNGNEPPQISDSRVHFYQGLFQQTLFTFLKEHKSSKPKIILMDADIYSATLFVLTSLSPYLRKGDILFFDEFNVPLHEFKAFWEWTNSFYIQYTVLGSVNNFYQIAVRIDQSVNPDLD